MAARGRWGNAEGLSLVATPEVGRALDVGEVRVEVRAAGLNFRDVLIALGMYPEAEWSVARAPASCWGSVRVSMTWPPGDRVMGLFDGAFGPVAVADRRLLVGCRRDGRLQRAASVPIVFLTAYYALVDLAGLRQGERLLVHAGDRWGRDGRGAVGAASGCRGVRHGEPGKWDVLDVRWGWTW